MICLPGLCPRSQRGGGPKLSQQASVFPSCTPRIRSLRAFRPASKKLLLLLLLRSLIITTQHKSLHLSNLPIILGAPMGSTLMQIRAGRSPYNRADALGTTSPASTQALTTPSNGIMKPETKRQVRPAWAPCSCVLVLSRTDKEGHNTVKLVRQRSPKQHPKGCWGLLGLESRQFFEEEPVTNLDIVEKAHIDRAKEPTYSKTVSKRSANAERTWQNSLQE